MIEHNHEHLKIVLNHNKGLYVALKDCSCLLETEFDRTEKNTLLDAANDG